MAGKISHGRKSRLRDLQSRACALGLVLADITPSQRGGILYRYRLDYRTDSGLETKYMRTLDEAEKFLDGIEYPGNRK